jgi:hypothetical protein
MVDPGADCSRIFGLSWGALRLPGQDGNPREGKPIVEHRPRRPPLLSTFPSPVTTCFAITSITLQCQ